MTGSATIDTRLSGLIGDLYDAAIDERLWAGIAPRIATAFDSTSAVLKIHGGNDVDLLDTTENLVVAPSDRSLAEHWHRNDLWVERSIAFGMSRVITSDDLVSPAETKRNGFYQDWLRQLGIYHMVGAVFPAGHNRVGVLGIHRPHRAGYYSDADRQGVEILLPHLQRALQLGRRLAGTSLAQASSFDALESLDIGVLVVDRSRRIVHANALAEDIVRTSPEIGMLNGRLVARDHTLDRRLATLVRDNLATAGGNPVRPATALSVPRDRHMPLTLAITPLRSIGSRLTGQPPLALVFLRDPERSTILSDQLCDLFGLTRTEAAVAADLTHGRSLAQIAEAHGVGLATVRSHLKKILAKTGTSRQAEVVALIASSIAAIVNPR
jgi:DNA-binding CsgD family transcriptional regulator/PAS domain-containing protein